MGETVGNWYVNYDGQLSNSDFDDLPLLEDPTEDATGYALGDANRDTWQNSVGNDRSYTRWYSIMPDNQHPELEPEPLLRRLCFPCKIVPPETFETADITR